MSKKTIRFCLLTGTLFILLVFNFLKINYDLDEFRTTVSHIIFVIFYLFLNFQCEIVTARGFQCEKHYVLTHQGYDVFK